MIERKYVMPRPAIHPRYILADATARDQAIRHFFGRALREVRGYS
jgi:hypothetical protein